MLARASVFEKQRRGVAQVEHHHRVRHSRLGDADPGFGNHDGRIDEHFLGFLGRLLEDDIRGFFLSRGLVNWWYGGKKKLQSLAIGTVWRPEGAAQHPDSEDEVAQQTTATLAAPNKA